MANGDQSLQNNPGFFGGLVDLVSNLKNVVVNLSHINTSIQNAFPRISGTFTLANATVTVVTQPAVGASWRMSFVPTNATGALTQRTNGLFHSATVASTSFSVSTQSGSAIGTETFEYIGFNPS